MAAAAAATHGAHVFAVAADVLELVAEPVAPPVVCAFLLLKCFWRPWLFGKLAEQILQTYRSEPVFFAAALIVDSVL